MAKFELPVYNAETDEIIKVHKRNFMPVGLYIKYQAFSEKLINDKVKNDAEMFKLLQPLFLETFPTLTAAEYNNNTDVAEVLVMFRNILDTATQITAGSSKNA